MNPQISTAIISALIAVAAFNSWISRINQFFYFSCSVSPEFASTPRARLITRSYLKGVWLGFSASMLVFGAAMLWTQLSATLCLGAALAVECFCCCAAFARAHRKAGAAIVESAALDKTMGHVAVQEPGLVLCPFWILARSPSRCIWHSF